MASFLTPQVDHNLYTPVLPRTNVGEIFQLINSKQQIYNSNLAKINNQRSFISDLDDNLSSQFVKDKVNAFNKNVDQELKKLTNLDFSITDNVNLITNMYNPILKDQDFLIDYSTTSHLNNEKNKALAYRDSNDKDKRDGFSMTNLRYVTDGLDIMAKATDSKSLRKAANYASQRYYSPYVDVPAFLSKTLKDFNAEIEYDDVSKGYVVKRTGMAADPNFAESLQDFLELVLPENAKNQLKINATVQVDDLVRRVGKDEVAADYLSKIPEQVKLIDESLQKELTEVNDALKIFPPENKMSDANREQYKLLLKKINTIETLKDKNNERNKTYTELQNNLDNGTYSSDDIVQLLIEDVYDSNKDGLLSGLADQYATKHSKITVDAASFSAANRLKYDYANMAQQERFHQDDLNQKNFENTMRVAEYKAKLKELGLDEDLNPDGNEFAEDEVSAYNTIDEINAKLIGYKTQKVNANEKDIQLFKNWWLEKTGHEPNEASIENYKKGGYNYSPELRKMFQSSSIFNPKKDSEEIWFTTEIQSAINSFNQKEGNGQTIVRLNQKTGLVEYVPNKEYEEKVFGKNTNTKESNKFKLGETGEYTKDGDKIISRQNPNTGIIEYYSVDKYGNTKFLEDQAKPYRTNSPVRRDGQNKNVALSKFETFLKTSKEKGGYGFGMDVITQGVSFPSGKAGRAAFNTIYGETMSYMRNITEEGDNLWGTIKTYNPELKSSDEDAALLAFEKMKILLNSEDSKPGVTWGSSKKGTKFSFSDEDVAKVFDLTQSDLAEADPTTKRAIQLLRNGMNFLVPHNKYSSKDYLKASIESGKTITVGNLSVYKNPNSGVYKIYPKNNFYHYEFDQTKEDIKVELTEDGYILHKLKEPLESFPQSGFRQNLTENLYSLQSRIEDSKDFYESSDFRVNLNNNINKYLKDGNQLLKNADGTYSIPNSLLPK